MLGGIFRIDDSFMGSEVKGHCTSRVQHRTNTLAGAKFPLGASAQAIKAKQLLFATILLVQTF